MSCRAWSPLRAALILLSILGPAVAACGDNLDPTVDRDRSDGAVVFMTYNVQQQGDSARGHTIAEHITRRAPDFVAYQELSQPDALGALLPDRYQLTEPPHAGIAVLYDADAWLLEDHGSVELGFDDDGWGARKVVWGHFTSRDTGEPLNFYSTHWCYPYRSDEDRCDEARQLEYAVAAAAYVQSTRGDDPAVLGGDLNNWDHYEEGQPFRTLIDSGLVDVYRILHPEGRALTHPDSTGGPGGGRVDYILSTQPGDVLDATVEDQIPIGDGSDHYAVRAALRYGPLPPP